MPDRDWCCQHVKIADFGLCNIGGGLGNDDLTGVTVGTDPYMSPEMTSKPKQIDNDEKKEKCDVYSFGILLLTIAMRKEPWQEQLRKRGKHEVRTWVEEEKDVTKGRKHPGSMHAVRGRPPIPREIDDQYKDLIESCWAQEPAERPMFRDIATALGPVSNMLVLAREDDSSGVLWDMQAFYRKKPKGGQMPDTEAGHLAGVEALRKHGLDTFEALHDLVHRASVEQRQLMASPPRLSPGSGGMVAEGVPPPLAGAGPGATAELEQLLGSYMYKGKSVEYQRDQMGNWLNKWQHWQ